jgi:DNA-binding transcriptional ArsR family regulator
MRPASLRLGLMVRDDAARLLTMRSFVNHNFVPSDSRLDACARAPILNHMVYHSPQLNRTFAALSDPTRRALLARLEAEDTVSVSDLAKPFAMSLPAIMKHLDVLTDAGLVTRKKTGRTVACQLRAEPMQEAMNWLGKYERFWSERLDRLAAYLEETSEWPKEQPVQQPSASQALPSSAATTRRPKKSTPPGRARK